MSDRYYIVRAEVRDTETDGIARLGVHAASRDAAVSKARAYVRTKSNSDGRIRRIVSARLSVRMNQKEAHS